MSVAILIPVLARPHRVAPVLESARSTTPGATVLFIVDPGDEAELSALEAAGAEYLTFEGNYAQKIRAGVEHTTESLAFLGADDLEFRPGWLKAATAYLDGQIQVVGVNDALERKRRPQHATHFLMTRRYATRPTIDGRPGPLCDLYDHSWVDDELIATARKRGVYVYAPDSVVAHLHWMNGKAEDDPVYRKGRKRYREDRKLHRHRIKLWR